MLGDRLVNYITPFLREIRFDPNIIHLFSTNQLINKCWNLLAESIINMWGKQMCIFRYHNLNINWLQRDLSSDKKSQLAKYQSSRTTQQKLFTFPRIKCHRQAAHWKETWPGREERLDTSLRNLKTDTPCLRARVP